jgi:uncharacterized membrane protein YeaQ/YmgE (transglycosylase-associated protein family)
VQIALGIGIWLVIGVAGGVLARFATRGSLGRGTSIILGVVGAVLGGLLGSLAGSALLAARGGGISTLTFYATSLLVLGVPAVGLPLAAGLVTARRRQAVG